VFSAIARFELRYHLRGALFYILLLCYFLLTFGAVTTDAVRIGGAIGNVHRNAPFVIMQFLLVMSIFGILTTTAFVANSIHRDFELGTDALFFSAPIKRLQFLAGRFLGSFSVAVLVYTGVALAIVIGSLMPWLEKERLGPFALYPYIFSVLFLVIPNLLLAGAIFFSVAALTRSLMATYSSVVAFLVAYAVAGSLLEDIDNEKLGALLDPFGFTAFGVATRYWTVFQKNTLVLPLSGIYLWNRVLWLGFALAVLAFTFWRFRFTTGTRKASRRARKAEPADAAPMERISLALPRVAQQFGGRFSWTQYFATVGLETRGIFKSIPFAIMLLLGVLNVWGGAVSIEDLFGTPVYPVTHLMIDVIQQNFAIFALLIAAFYAGDIVWRERNLKLSDVVDAMPVPTWTQWLAKLTSLVLVVFTTLAAAVLTTIVIQTAKGYHHYELGVYAKSVLQIGVWLALLTGLAFVMQVLFNQKFVGFLGVMLYFIVNRALPALDHEHRLYRFGSVPPFDYSDMNGFGHFVKPIVSFDAYWLFFAAILLVVAHLFWVRGTETALRQRRSLAGQRFNVRVAAALALFVVGFAAIGGYIYDNTNVLNRYRTTKERERLQADFEKKYKRYERIAQPRITDVQADVDLFPERRAVDIRGHYTLVNKTAAPIAELHVVNDVNTLTTAEVSIPGARVKSDDRTLGYTIYTLSPPLAPGASLPLAFHTGFAARGFVNGESNTQVVANGTFINSSQYFPHLGYQSGSELQDPNKRRKNGLGPLERMRPATDLAARGNNYISTDSDWLNLDTTVSTVADQTAIAPGYLQRTWTANGRRYFRYKTTSPILGFWSYLSARYSVKRDRWKGIPIEVYYDAKHPYNVDRMIYAVKKSLNYYTTHFSPYQHQQVRILEFPRYARFAQSFPNTIPFSESIGFIADLRDKDAIDYVYYVTAHEVAHQWWAHQVIGGNVQGSTMLSETMAQYSALMVQEHEYGAAKMQKFLKYELDRYLRDRGGELVAEMPLVRVENQGYIHYRKGSLVMYALRDAIGEDRVDSALAKFLHDYGFQNPPYTTAPELVRYFRAVAPADRQSLITDLFERITLYDVETRDATATKRADGKYVVTMTVTAQKLRSDAKGEEQPVPVDDWIDIGVLGDKDKVLFVEKRRITKPSETFTFVVSEKPKRAGIDPFNKLIDRNPKDNTKGV
jgi:ABC-2 type transport system permease protein